MPTLKPTSRAPHISLGVIIIICLGVTANGGDLQAELARLQKQAGQPGADLHAIEGEYLHLLRDRTSTEDVADVRVAVARMYARDVRNYAKELAGASQRALVHPVRPETAAELYMFWGDALWAQALKADAPVSASGMREIARPYIDGIRVIEQSVVSLEPKPLPVVEWYDYDGEETDPLYGELEEKRLRQIAAFEGAKQHNRLVKLRRTLIRQVASLYENERRIEDLRETVSRLIGDPVAAGRLVDEIQAERAEEHY